MKSLTKHLLAVGALTSLAAFAADGGATTPSANRELVSAMFAAFNAHDVTALKTFYAEDARVYSPEHCDPRVGVEAIVADYAALFAQIPDVHDAVETIIAEGDRVAVYFTASSKLPGAEFRLPIAAFMTIKNGKVVEDRTLYQTETPAVCETP